MLRTRLLKTVAVIAMAFTRIPAGWAAGHEVVLHSFQPGGDGSSPQAAGVIADAQGNLYGVTNAGGAGGVGVVYELSPQADGAWTETLLYSFPKSGVNGASPSGSLVFDQHGNLYGAATAGGP